MRGILQFGDGSTPIVYKYLGTIRPVKGKFYRVTAIKNNNRSGNPEIVAYRLTCTALVKDLESTFTSADSHAFRMIFPDSMEMIELGTQFYALDYDGLIVRNNIEYHTIHLDFIIPVSQLSTYITRVPLPASEGGVVIDDSDIYIE